MKLKTLIVDDETPARERLKRFLAHDEMVEIIGEAEDGKSAVEMIEEKNPDLVLLDIQMPNLDGFEVIRMLTKPPLIIFVTAYDRFAIQAFEVNALDYLLKPFTKARLDKAIEKASQELSGKAGFNARLDTLLQTIDRQKGYLERIAVRHQSKIFVIPINEIDRISAEEGSNYLHVKDGRFSTKYTLDELNNRLSPRIFFRAHRSAIINLNRVKEVIPWFAGSYRVLLSSGVEIDISRNRVKELRKILNW